MVSRGISGGSLVITAVFSPVCLLLLKMEVPSYCHISDLSLGRPIYPWNIFGLLALKMSLTGHKEDKHQFIPDVCAFNEVDCH